MKALQWFKWVLLSIILIIVITTWLIEKSRGSCNRYYESINDSYNGIVVRKFLSRNHNWKAIEFKSGRTKYIHPFDIESFMT